MATSHGLLDFIGQVKPTIDNHPTHHQTEGETIFLEGFTASGIVAFFETFFHHGMDYDRTTVDGNQPRNKPPEWSRMVAGTPEGGIIHSIALVVRGSNPTLLVFYAKSTKKHY